MNQIWYHWKELSKLYLVIICLVFTKIYIAEFLSPKDPSLLFHQVENYLAILQKISNEKLMKSNFNCNVYKKSLLHSVKHWSLLNGHQVQKNAPKLLLGDCIQSKHFLKQKSQLDITKLGLDFELNLGAYLRLDGIHRQVGQIAHARI